MKYIMMILFLFFLSGCESLPKEMLPGLENLESIQIYNERGQLVSGRDCQPREDGGKICTTILPDGKKTVAEYGPENKLK